MYTVRWIRGEKGRSSVKDERFATKQEALDAISNEKIASITRLPQRGHKMWAVQVKPR